MKITVMLSRAVALIPLFVLATAVHAAGQERFSFFQASTPESVERMLTLADLRDDDVVVDLGSGDGIIPLMAAQMNPKLRGFGVDIDAALVEKSNARAKEEGVADRVRFAHQNAFDADLSEATVITMWLFPELMRLLRPVILERARPGTRVLTNTWDLGAWQPDAQSPDDSPTYMWIVPARVAGAWDWTIEAGGRKVPYAAVLEQRFQEIEGVVRAGDRREVFQEMTLRGADIEFTLEITLDGLGLTRHEFRGTVAGDRMTGTVSLTPATGAAVTVPWEARHVEQSAYFAPTGTKLPGKQE
jgi:hypothetical protein